MTALSAPTSDPLRDAAPKVFWTDRPGAPEPADPLTRTTPCDLLIVGGGFTGLWAAVEARAARPDATIMLVEAETVAFGGSGRNGGFISESLTHGLAHGEQLWPGEMPELVRLGRDNLREIVAFAESEGIAADLRLCGKTALATSPHHLEALAASAVLHDRFGEDVTLQTADEVRADVDSPTYLGGLRVRSGGGLVDPSALAWGLRAAAIRRGIDLYEHTPVLSMRRSRSGVEVATPRARIDAGQVLLATNAYPPLLRRLRHRVLPVYDHVLVTEPLPEAALDEVGWRDGQGLTDAGNQFHYYRLTSDRRILWGGYDAIYYFGNRTDAWREQRDASHELLAGQFYATFPQLAPYRFTHRWAGPSVPPSAAGWPTASATRASASRPRASGPASRWTCWPESTRNGPDWPWSVASRFRSHPNRFATPWCRPRGPPSPARTRPADAGPTSGCSTRSESVSTAEEAPGHARNVHRRCPCAGCRAAGDPRGPVDGRRPGTLPGRRAR
jgi:glycine/D-amino acid oxidase-like deaminating enzyme